MDIENVAVRGLTRGNVKELKSQGIKMDNIDDLDDEKREIALDKIIGWACPDISPDDITPGDALELYVRIVEATFAGSSLLKKYNSPLHSSSAAGNGTAKNAEEPDSSSKDTARTLKEKSGSSRTSRSLNSTETPYSSARKDQ